MRWYEDRAKLLVAVEQRRAEGSSPMEAERWVRILCDYALGSVWSRDGTAGQPEQLPLSLDLMVRMHRWEDLFEECEVLDQQGHHWTPEQDRAWSDEGLAIAIEMKRELPGWTVVYHDGWRMAAADSVTIENPRAFFEYEVTDKVVQSGRRPIAGGTGLLRLEAKLSDAQKGH